MMVNGVVLVVDAFEGAMQATKFSINKSLAAEPSGYCMYQQNRPPGGKT